MTHKQRIATSHPMETYSFANFLAYVLYPPLYIAGPIMSFNDFMWQVCTSSSNFTRILLLTRNSVALTKCTQRAQDSSTNCLRNPFSCLPPHDGVNPASHVCGRNQRHPCLAWSYSGTTEHGRILEPCDSLDEGKIVHALRWRL